MLSKKTYDLLMTQLEDNIERLLIRFEKGNVNERELDDVLFFGSQIFDSPILGDYETRINSIIQYILERLRKELYSGDYTILKYAGMCKGIGNVAFSINNISQATNSLNEFNSFLGDLLADSAQISLKYLETSPLTYRNYDLLYGVSGVLYYLLDFESKRECNTVKAIANYLVNLTEDKVYKEKAVIGFHIHQKQQLLSSEREEMPDGNINFGMAHGMMGALIALSKMKYYNIEIPDLNKAINKLRYIYDKFMIYDEGMLKYPIQLPLNCYYTGRANRYSANSGWCYGNAGIVRGLMKANKYIHDDTQYHFFEKELLKILNQSLVKYNFSVPILCHGNASIIALQLATYKETKNDAFLATLERNIISLINEHQSLMKRNEEKYVDIFQMLEGVAGVTLTLLKAIQLDLTFDKILMID